jgi:hypothetical protein
MLNVQAGSGFTPPPGFFALLTAQAWLDPDLASLLARDKQAAVARFAGDEGLELPAFDAIEAFELPANPVGHAEPLGQADSLYASYSVQAEMCGGTPNCSHGCFTSGCSSDCSGACTVGCSYGCTNACSVGCPTVGCSAGCPTANGCTTGCTLGFCTP